MPDDPRTLQQVSGVGMNFIFHPTETGRGLILRVGCSCGVDIAKDWPGEWRIRGAFPCRQHAEEWEALHG